jgi:Rrf2 family protein
MGNTGHSMQLSRAADYAIRAMIHMAGLPDGTRSQLSELAQVIDVPESFLSKILQSLRRAGFIESRRGTAGGFEILAFGRAATISAVIAAIEGPIRLNLCVMPDDSCNRKGHCPAHPVWARAQEAMMTVLNAHTIAVLAKGVRTPPQTQPQITITQ